MPNFFLSEDDVNLLKRLIDEAERRGFGVRVNPPTRSPVTAKNDNSPEVYVAYPPIGGIPGTDAVDDYPDLSTEYPNDYLEYPSSERIVGSAECDIYRVLRDGSLDKLQEVVGLSKTVFNLGDSTISRAFIPIARDKFGNWIALSGAGGNAQSAQIKFEILDWLPGDPLTSPCEAVYAVVTQVSCGSSVQVGDEVIVWDPDLCWFDLPTSLLIGMKGSANLMRTNTLGLPTMPPMCFTPPEDECSWVVENMCCSEQIYE